MFYLISNSLKIFTFTGLIVLFAWVLDGNIHSAFAETTMDPDIVMTFDTSEILDEDAEVFNKFLNFITATYVSTGGDLEVVVLDQNTICISAYTNNCTSKAAPQNRDMVTERESKKAPVTILTAYDQ